MSSQGEDVDRGRGSEVRCGRGRWRWFEDGSEIARENVERKSARVRCASRRSCETIRRAVTRTADEMDLLGRDTRAEELYT